MSELRAYIAQSLDGLIATADGGISWLDPYNSPELGFAEFFAQIGTVVVGRKTFDQSLGFSEWPYADRRVIVQTRRPLADAGRRVERHEGDVDALVRELRREPRDTWLVGGAESLRVFRGHVDRWEIFVIPVLLGSGVPLFAPASVRAKTLRLVSARSYSNGVVGLEYRAMDRRDQ